MNPEDQDPDLADAASMAIMCCMCKKIRQDDGSWKDSDPSILEYVGDVYSHGYCETCRDQATLKLDEIETVRVRRAQL